jgi:hypothetical protein
VPPAYNSNPKHRNNSPQGSQWTITTADEYICFASADRAGWLLPAEGWGLHLVAGTPDYLGIGVDRSRRLFLAKFVASTSPPTWHGYPADHEMHQQDIPHPKILDKWLQSKTLTAPKIRKLGKGQPCRL